MESEAEFSPKQLVAEEKRVMGLEKYKNRITALATGVFLLVSVAACKTEGQRFDEKSKIKAEQVEKSITGDASLDQILEKIMGNKLPENASRLDEIKKYQGATDVLKNYARSQADKEKMRNALTTALQNPDVIKDKALHRALLEIIFTAHYGN
ncbi:hypothetical protein A2661_02180 [Candidatus Giovannonibacteria bacterium RIFCSPHIGHO2_01_FULL_45_24]|nr:MAG: hypothetical protein A2661_02180 [Candidatus Giovannonibacteria bacterium RIFCSPHIGHO2_01_FULL_45_24]